MPIFQQQAQAILNYANNLNNQMAQTIQLNATTQIGGPCGKFVCALIENATGQQIITQRNDIFNQNQVIVGENPDSTFIFILDPLTFTNFPIGSILGIYSMTNHHIRHYVVKLQDNRVIGINHGYGWQQRQANFNGLFIDIQDTDFNNGYFIYENENCFLLGFDYTLQ